MAAEKLTRRGREMRRILERCERSGLTLSEFARRQRMALPTLAWWRQNLAPRPGRRLSYQATAARNSSSAAESTRSHFTC